MIKKREAFKIATWNARSLYEMMKVECARNEMKRMNIDILGISEMRWKGSGTYDMPEHVIYYAGNDEPSHWRGVCFIVTKRMNMCVRNFIPHSDRVCMIQCNGNINLNVIQVYAPTADGDEEETERFYEEVRTMLRMTKREEVNVIMGDFNAKVGSGVSDGVTGRHGLGERNERGERMIQFCQEEEFVITNTLFELPA